MLPPNARRPDNRLRRRKAHKTNTPIRHQGPQPSGTGRDVPEASQPYVEKRRRDRAPVKHGSVAEFKRPRLFNIGKARVAGRARILEISPGGLTIQYAGHRMWPLDFSKLTIAVHQDRLIIEDLPVKVVTDYQIDQTQEGVPVRRCGLKFDALSKAAIAGITHFIQHYTLENPLYPPLSEVAV